MDLVQAVVLAVLQGVTEFLPISSSAHLILVPHVLGWPDQGLAFDVAVHVGSLTAVLMYFRHEVRALWSAWMRQVAGGTASAESRLAWAVLFGTVPVAVAGLLFKDTVETTLRDPMLIAAATLVFALLLWWADRTARHTRDEYDLTWRDVVAVGCAQALALIPGTSRSGITMTAGLAVGLTRAAAARFSFLLSIPVIVLAGADKTYDLVMANGLVPWSSLITAAVLSGVSAYSCIHLFLKLIERVGMTPFVVYRVLLAALLLFLHGQPG